MRISGAAVLNAPRDRVYAALTDPVVLARTIPGCRQLEPAGDDTYRMVVMAGVGSIRGRFTGEVQLRDQQPPLRCVLHASGQGAPGTVHAVTRICLTALEETRTTVEYEADAVVGGMVGGVGQRLLAGAARRMASELFGAVDAELARPA
ncbi:MAG: SRPBCC family protein, partial [Acidimicrobiales bacterium]